MENKSEIPASATLPIAIGTGRDNRQSKIRLVFLGTPEFAVSSLDALVRAGFNIAAVVTAPDKHSGRRLKLNESAVKKYAVAHGLKILQPQKLKSPEFLEELRALNADLQLVVAFRMLPEIVWNMPRLGTINLHASLLPQYRGAAPINWAIINGEKETGVTTFKLKQEIDTGDILMQEAVPIGEEETAGELHDRLKKTGAKLLVKTVKGLADGTLTEIPQAEIGNRLPTAPDSYRDGMAISNVQDSPEDYPDGNAPIDESMQEDQSTMVNLKPAILHHAPKIFTQTSEINWNQPVTNVYNLIRGLSPNPGAFTYLQDRILKIYRSKKDFTTPNIPPGAISTDKKTYLKIAAMDGYIHPTDVQLEGKKRMSMEDFLRGYRWE